MHSARQALMEGRWDSMHADRHWGRVGIGLEEGRQAGYVIVRHRERQAGRKVVQHRGSQEGTVGK
jgi:hypothetical protein